jgi:dephospho-CoA kinase
VTITSLKVALTGGIATGKSRVAQWFVTEHQVPLIDTDQVAHTLLKEDGAVRRFLSERLGGEAFESETGNVIRSRVGERLFQDPIFKAELEGLMHPKIRQSVKDFFTKHEGQTPLIIAEVPLLFETGVTLLYDECWLVYASEAVQRQRLSASRGYEEVEISRRLANQLPIESKKTLAHRIIDNNGLWEQTLAQLQSLWSTLFLM